MIGKLRELCSLDGVSFCFKRFYASFDLRLMVISRRHRTAVARMDGRAEEVQTELSVKVIAGNRVLAVRNRVNRANELLTVAVRHDHGAALPLILRFQLRRIGNAIETTKHLRIA